VDAALERAAHLARRDLHNPCCRPATEVACGCMPAQTAQGLRSGSPRTGVRLGRAASTTPAFNPDAATATAGTCGRAFIGGELPLGRRAPPAQAGEHEQRRPSPASPKRMPSLLSSSQSGA